MPKPGSKLRIRLIDPNIKLGEGQTVEGLTIDNELAYIWISLAKKLEYSTGSGPTYQKKVLHFENSMTPEIYDKSRRKVKVRRVTHKAHGLYPEDPSDIFEDEDKDHEFIEVEDIEEFTIGEGSGPGYQQTTFVMKNPENISESRAGAVTVGVDGRKTHRVRIYHQQWVETWDGSPIEDRGAPEPRWTGIDYEGDQPTSGEIGIARSHVWFDVERIDEFTTTTGSGPTYQKTHWRVIWDDLDQDGRNRDPFKDAKFDKFLFGDNLDQPPDENGDPIGYMADVDAQGNPIQVLVKTDINMPKRGRGWRLDPFQTIVNVHWGYAPENIQNSLYFQFVEMPQFWSGGLYQPPPNAAVVDGTGLYAHNGYSESGVRGAAAANDATELPGQDAGNRNFFTLWGNIDVTNPASEGNRHRLWIVVPFVPPEEP